MRAFRVAHFKRLHWLLGLWISFLMGGVVFSVLLPPFQVPDEIAHWKTANSRIDHFIRRTQPNGCSVYDQLPELLKAESLIRFYRLKWTTGLYAKLADSRTSCQNTEAATYGNLLTYPGVLGARALLSEAPANPRSALWVFYLARFLGGGITALILFRALVLERRKDMAHALLGLFFVFCLSPLWMQQSYGVTSDGIVFASVALLSLLTMRSSQLAKGEKLAAAVLCFVAVLTKPTLIGLFGAFAVLLGIKELIDSAEEKRQGQKFLDSIGLLAIVLAGIVYGLIFLSGKQAHLDPGVDPAAQLKYLIASPVAGLRAVWTGTPNALGFLRGLVGNLGWAELTVEKPTRVAYFTLLLISLASDGMHLGRLKSKIQRKSWRRPVTLAFLALVATLLGHLVGLFLPSLALYLYNTPVRGTTVIGYQPRYYLPNLFLFLAAFSIVIKVFFGQTAEHERAPESSQVLALPLFTVLVWMPVYLSALAIDLVSRYY